MASSDSAKKKPVITASFAKQYDSQGRQYGWVSPEVLFGLSYEFCSPGQSILDIGIGTGQSSKLYSKAGLKVFGLDNSKEMIQVCQRKGIADALHCIDITRTPYPFPENSFDHVTVCGVFHLIDSIETILSECKRLLKPGACLTFTYEAHPDQHDHSNSDGYREIRTKGIYRKSDPGSGIDCYRHSDEYIKSVLEINHFEMAKEMTFRAYKVTPWADARYFTAILSRSKIDD